jgi:iturin family lipopeptide synthetase A
VSISGAVPIGLPIANTQFYVLDRALRPVPVGVPGELYIGGDGVAWGYLNRPQQTAAAFVPDPFNHPEGTRPGARLYKTGDLVRYLPDHDANIEFLGRLDDQVKIRGYRVELAEVEAALIEHPQVREVAVLARQAGPAHALGAKRLVAYVVAENNEQANNGTTEQREDEEPQEPSESLAAELRRFLQKSLPEYMVPSAFVVLDALPLTPHGKLDRHALPLPDRSDTEAETAFVPARGMLEQQLVNLWEEILGIQPVGVTDNFFALGGNSLLAMRMVAQIQQRVGAEMTLPALFANPTIAEIAALLNDQSYPGVLRHFDELAEQSSPLVALRPSGANRPFFLVAPLGGILPSTVIVGVLDLVHYLDREQPYYGLQLPPMAIDLARQMRAHQTMDDEQLREILRQSPSGDQVVANAASQCISAIRQVQKQGPYLIGGFCSGSIVAFEVARLLRAQGHEIDLLLLIDSEAPLEAGVASFETTEIDDHAGRLAWFACRDLAGEKAGLLKKDVPEVAADLERLPREDRYAYVRDLLAEAVVVPRDTESHEIRRLYQIYRTNLESLNFILHSYSPPAYPGPITLVRVMEGGESNDPTLGWGRLAEGGVSILWTPGDHGTLFLPQHIEVLAKLMTECLDAAQAPQVTSLPS